MKYKAVGCFITHRFVQSLLR